MLAIQFGRASGNRAALRDAIGHIEDGKWHRSRPDPAQYDMTMTPHARGAVLVAAIFDAFLAIYNTRTADLLRLSTGGSGVLPAGAIHPDLVHRLCEEARQAPNLSSTISPWFDYLPPSTSLSSSSARGHHCRPSTFARDRLNYRVSFIARSVGAMDPTDGFHETPRLGAPFH